VFLDPNNISNFKNEDYNPSKQRIIFRCSTSLFKTWLGYYQRYSSPMNQLREMKRIAEVNFYSQLNDLSETNLKYEKLLKDQILSSRELGESIKYQLTKQDLQTLDSLEFVIERVGDQVVLKLKEKDEKKRFIRQ